MLAAKYNKLATIQSKLWYSIYGGVLLVV